MLDLISRRACKTGTRIEREREQGILHVAGSLQESAMRPSEPTCGVPERRHASHRFLGSTTVSPQATRRSSSNSQLFAPHIRICILSQVHLYALRIFRDTNQNTVPHEPPLTVHGHIHISLQKITPIDYLVSRQVYHLYPYHFSWIVAFCTLTNLT